MKEKNALNFPFISSTSSSSGENASKMIANSFVWTNLNLYQSVVNGYAHPRQGESQLRCSTEKNLKQWNLMEMEMKVKFYEFKEKNQQQQHACERAQCGMLDKITH